MTYCLAMRLPEGLVFLSDTRTNAGVDNIGMYRKLHRLQPAPDRLFVLQSAGNLATTQEVLDRIRRDLRLGEDDPSLETLATVGELWEAALYIGRLSLETTKSHSDGLGESGGKATFILGGQIAGTAPDILLIYPEGNYIRASESRPFLQIGETKYGKFLLEVAGTTQSTLPIAVKVALGSMVTTARANLSVGPPYDLGIYRTDSYHLDDHRITDDSPVLTRLEQLWRQHILAAIDDLPTVTDSTETLRIPFADTPVPPPPR